MPHKSDADKNNEIITWINYPIFQSMIIRIITFGTLYCKSYSDSFLITRIIKNNPEEDLLSSLKNIDDFDTILFRVITYLENQLLNFSKNLYINNSLNVDLMIKNI